MVGRAAAARELPATRKVLATRSWSVVTMMDSASDSRLQVGIGPGKHGKGCTITLKTFCILFNKTNRLYNVSKQLYNLVVLFYILYNE
jgi:hypothetical protein